MITENEKKIVPVYISGGDFVLMYDTEHSVADAPELEQHCNHPGGCYKPPFPF